MDVRTSKRKPSKRELSSKQVFTKTFASKLIQYKTYILENVDDYKDKDVPDNWKDKLSGKTRSIMAVLDSASLSQNKKGKLQEFERIAELLSHKDFIKDARKVARLFARIYQDLLERCTHKDAIVFARVCMDSISYNIKEGKLKVFDELLQAPSLQAMLIKSKKKIPKETLDMKKEEGKDRSTHDAIFRSALYCVENDTFYKCSDSEVTKFGFLTFENLDDVKVYEDVLKAIDKKYEYKPMPKELGKLLRRESFLRRHDDESEDASLELVKDKKVTPRSEDSSTSSSSKGKASRSIS